jgi:lysophospholipase L1-like esterase
MSKNRPHLAHWLVGLLAIVTAALVTAALMRDATSIAVPAAMGSSGSPASAGNSADPGASVSSSPTATPSPSAEPKPATLDDAREALQDKATVSVIGDSTGNDRGEWVELWAQRLADDDRAVALHQWAGDDFQPEPIEYEGSGDEVTLWNASLSGGQANWANDMLATVQPERPDLILLNVGHNNVPNNVAGQLNELRREIDRRWDGQDIPLVAVLQNPGRGEHEDRQAATLRVIRTWATNKGVPTIDVTSAFTDPEKQMQDDAHPNERGSQIWADVVADSLAGDDSARGR